MEKMSETWCRPWIAIFNTDSKMLPRPWTGFFKTAGARDDTSICCWRMLMRRSLLVQLGVILIAGLFPGMSLAQLAADFHPPQASCCLTGAAQKLADQLQDWNQLGRYHQDDQRLQAQPSSPGRVVFMGDSITDGWNLAESFPTKPYVNRGISGQTTPQMLVRM